MISKKMEYFSPEKNVWKFEGCHFKITKDIICHVRNLYKRQELPTVTTNVFLAS